MSNLSRIPVDSRDWMRRRGRAVVLLKQRAGVTQEGNLKMRVVTKPSNIERRV